MKIENLKLAVKITKWESDPISSYGMNIVVWGKVVIPEFKWSLDFYSVYSPRNRDWPFERLTVEGEDVKLGERSIWWNMFMYLHKKGLLQEP